MRSDQLPRVDEHATETGAGVDDVRRALTEASTIPGFRVTAADPASSWVCRAGTASRPTP
jgi:hypothetical protein